MTQETGAGNEADHQEHRDEDRAADRAAELRELRLRAYGPDADIESDPAALARLRELEGMRRAAPGASSPGAAPAATSGPFGSPVPPRPPLPVSPPVAGERGSLPVADGNSDAAAAATGTAPVTGSAAALATESATPAAPAAPGARSWARRLAR